ncbi:unnamed protein product [Chondrus crispus]|uniref:Uncharacterized protein n=1 Tax=Chondrus crispus TaxID=2769 RepID=R7QSV1_CHOCR|nr:unnamed protein product [Chondrus crispus]CDF40586.1 unnamed protein product [Chondrus crispus]|eukprot:XP_005710880.1 unnamed protein product [Chondrus crispus]
MGRNRGIVLILQTRKVNLSLKSLQSALKRLRPKGGQLSMLRVVHRYFYP